MHVLIFLSTSPISLHFCKFAASPCWLLVSTTQKAAHEAEAQEAPVAVAVAGWGFNHFVASLLLWTPRWVWLIFLSFFFLVLCFELSSSSLSASASCFFLFQQTLLWKTVSIALHCQVAAQAFFSLSPSPQLPNNITASTLVICLSFCFWVFSEGFWFVVCLFVCF